MSAPSARRLKDLLEWMAERNWQTTYEKTNNIRGVGKEWVYDGENCKILIVNKSDGTDSLFVFLRVGLGSEFWFYSPLFDDMADMMLNAFPRFWRKMKEKEQQRGKQNIAEWI